MTGLGLLAAWQLWEWKGFLRITSWFWWALVMGFCTLQQIQRLLSFREFLQDWNWVGHWEQIHLYEADLSVVPGFYRKHQYLFSSNCSNLFFFSSKSSDIHKFNWTLLIHIWINLKLTKHKFSPLTILKSKFY